MKITINTLGKTLTDEQWSEIANDYGVVVEINDGNTYTCYSPRCPKYKNDHFLDNTFRNDVYEMCEEMSDYEKSRPTDED